MPVHNTTIMKYLLLAPHTDDIELGCGGTLLKLLEEGNEVHWVVFSTAEDSVPSGMPLDTLEKEFLSVAGSLGLSENQYEVCSYPVRNFDLHRQEILELLVSIRREIKPDVVIGPSLHDVHQDHQVIANEMVRAFKTSASILCYELPWNHTEFENQCFSKLDSNFIEGKIKLLANYQSQMAMNRSYFSAEFIKGWAKMRGIQCNSEYAESFEVVRWIL